MKSQYGEDAVKNTEFLALTRTLKQISKDQEIRKAQQQQQAHRNPHVSATNQQSSSPQNFLFQQQQPQPQGLNNRLNNGAENISPVGQQQRPGQNGPSIASDVFNQFQQQQLQQSSQMNTPGNNYHSPALENNQPSPAPTQNQMSPNQNLLQQQFLQQQQQVRQNNLPPNFQTPQSSQGVSQKPDTKGTLGSGLFTNSQSMLLKAQIAAFKCLVKGVTIPPDVTQIISLSLKVQSAMSSNSIESQPASRADIEEQPRIPQEALRKTSTNQQASSQISSQIPSQAQTPQYFPPQTIQNRTAPSDSPHVPDQMGNQFDSRTSVTPTESHNPNLAQLVVVQPQVPQNLIRVFEDQIPLPLEKLTNEHSEITSIIPINDPKLTVDSYTKPLAQKEVPYELSYNSKSRVLIPGVMPPGVDIEGASHIREALVQFNIHEALEQFRQQFQDVDMEEPNGKISDDLIDYLSLELLPYQKAIRGHILSFEYYKKSLLSNSHPNFLAKIRKVNLHDVNSTKILYEQQESLKLSNERKRKDDEIAKITVESSSIINNRQVKKEQISKLGKGITAMHVNIEREEQKRIERNAKQRLQALKANDEEAYIKLLDQTKDTRITHLLRQTNQFLDSLAHAVKEQQKESHLNARAEGQKAEPEPEDTTEKVTEEDKENIDYYSVAHKIKEEVKAQPSILIGGTLKEYQLKGLQWMVSLYNNHLNGILADEMGLGKTIQTISLLTYLVEVKKVHGPFLVIVPLSTLPNWNLEFEKWAPALKKITYKGSPIVRKVLQPEIRIKNFQVLLTTFEYIIKDRPLLSKINWAHMIIDEGHRMKNANSKLSLTLAQYYHTDYRLILTGTPLQNNLPELWALLNFVLPKIFNSVKSFDEWFNTPFANTGGQDKIALSEEETLLVIRRLHKVLRPFLLRRLKKDVEKDLPNKVEKVLKCKMSAVQSKMYQHMLKYHQIFVNDEDNEKLIPLKGLNNPIMQLRKICNHPFVFEEIEDYVNPSQEHNNIWRVAGKFELLERILPKFKATGHRVLMFFQMTQIMDIMEDFLRMMDMKYLRLDGSTKPDDRSNLLKLYNAPDSEYFAFLLSTRAGGLGLNLQTADTVIIFDTDWNPHQDLQAQDRAHRIGQKNEVRILRLITEDSVEEVILERAHQKLEIDGKVIQAGKFDNKSTAEEQEALLRALLEAEENKKSEDDEELDDHELNCILSRNEIEMEIFKKMDEDRKAKKQGRLFTESELPALYLRDPSEFMVETNVEDYGRGARERKQMFYDDNLTEEQWLKEIDARVDDGEDFDDEADEEDESVVKKRKKSAPRKKRRQLDDLLIDEEEAGDDGDHDDFRSTRRGRKRRVGSSQPEEGTSNGAVLEEGSAPPTNEGSDASTPRPRGRPPGGRSRTSTPAGRKPRGGKRGGGRGRGRALTPQNRDAPDAELLTEEDRSKLNQQALAIHQELLDYHNLDGRILSAIFLNKPERKLYPDYYILIKFPIAFDVIERRINSNYYSNLKEFIEDIHLMFSNCRTYNDEHSVLYGDAVELEQFALKRFKEITGDLTDPDFSDFDHKYLSKILINAALLNSNLKEPAATF